MLFILFCLFVAKPVTLYNFAALNLNKINKTFCSNDWDNTNNLIGKMDICANCFHKCCPADSLISEKKIEREVFVCGKKVDNIM